MKTFGKIMIGVAIATVGVIFVKKATEKKFHTVSGDDKSDETKTHKTVEKMKKAASEKALKILTFAGEHPKEIIGAGALAYAACEVIGGHMALDTGRALRKKNSKILTLLNDIKESTWNASRERFMEYLKWASDANKPIVCYNPDTHDVIASFRIVEEEVLT